MRLGRVIGVIAAAVALAAPSAHASTGGIFTVAGTGRAGFSGDGNFARLAQFTQPLDIAVMRDGPYRGYLVADSLNRRVRRVLPDGRIETVAGTGGLGSPPTAPRPSRAWWRSRPVSPACPTAGS